MSDSVSHLFKNNQQWAAKKIAQDHDFFSRLVQQQSPQYLWIGCSDSRVPANEIVGLPPGEIFVHRNIANLVVHTDLNCLSVLQFAVDILKIKHIMVVGHYGCSGVNAAMTDHEVGLSDNWLRHVQDVGEKHSQRVTGADHASRLAQLCELNVLEQAQNVARTSIVKSAWQKNQPLQIHGWIYGLQDGLLRELCSPMGSNEQASRIYQETLARY